MTHTVIVAVGDPLLHPETLHIAAATGLPVIDALEEPQRARAALRHCPAFLIDADGAAELDTTARTWHAPPGCALIFVSADPGPVDWPRAESLGAREAFVLPAQSTALLHYLSTLNAPSPQVEGGVRVIAVMGSSGGVGCSTLAVSLARYAAERGNRVLLIDATPHSGGLDLMVGYEDYPTAKWEDLSGGSTGRIAGGDLVAALAPESTARLFVLTHGRSRVLTAALSGAELEERLSRVLDAAMDATAKLDVVVVDVATRNKVAVQRCDEIVLLSAAEVMSVAEASAIAGWLQAEKALARVRGVLVHRFYSGVDVGEFEQLTGLTVVAKVRMHPRLGKMVENGGIPGTRGLPASWRAVVKGVIDG